MHYSATIFPYRFFSAIGILRFNAGKTCAIVFFFEKAKEKRKEERKKRKDAQEIFISVRFRFWLMIPDLRKQSTCIVSNQCAARPEI